MKNTWIELDLAVLRSNIEQAAKAAGSRRKIIFVVKSNAYGHGLEPVVACAAKCGVGWFAVSNIDEALLARNIAGQARILALAVMPPSRVPDAIANGVETVVVGEKHASDLARAARATGSKLLCHAKVDTGMGRLGFMWDTAAESIDRVRGDGGLELAGLCTHLAAADDPGIAFSKLQIERLNSVAASCEGKGIRIPFRHASNSSAFLMHPEWDMDAVRLGIAMYGYGMKSAGAGARAATLPFLQWKTSVAQVKQVPAGSPIGYNCTHTTRAPTCIGVLDVGYADGYFRSLSNRAFVLVRGRRRPAIGLVSMNYVTIDLGPDTDVTEGDEATLIGEQNGEAIWADEVASWCGTIPYEVLTNIRCEHRNVLPAPIRTKEDTAR